MLGLVNLPFICWLSKCHRLLQRLWRSAYASPAQIVTEVLMTKLKYSLYLAVLTMTLSLPGQPAQGADQTVPGAGNDAAVTLSNKSPMVQSAKEFLVAHLNSIDNSSIRVITLDAIANPSTCVAHRGGVKDVDKSAILHALIAAGLVDTRDDNTFRSEEHTSELQSHSDLVCRLLLEKKKIYICNTLLPHHALYA